MELSKVLSKAPVSHARQAFAAGPRGSSQHDRCHFRLGGPSLAFGTMELVGRLACYSSFLAEYRCRDLMKRCCGYARGHDHLAENWLMWSRMRAKCIEVPLTEADWLDDHLELCAFAESPCIHARACWIQDVLSSLRSCWPASVDADAVLIRWAAPNDESRLMVRMQSAPAGSSDFAVKDAKVRLAGAADEHTFRLSSASEAVYALPIVELMWVVAVSQEKAGRPRRWSE